MPSEQQLSEVLSEFARTMVTDFPIQGILDHLVERIVDVLPITAAGVTLISPGIRSPLRRRIGRLGIAVRGAADRAGRRAVPRRLPGRAIAVVVPDLREDARFPNFSRSSHSRRGWRRCSRSRCATVTSGSARSTCTGTRPGRSAPDAMEAAQTLADVAAAYLLNAQARVDLRESSDRSRENALHDPLTGLPNRTLLLERLDHAVMRSRRSGTTAAVLFADLDRFKLVNDLYGHSVGDELLVAVAQRLSAVLRAGDTLARMSGDEFVILCEDLEGPAHVDAIAARIIETVGAPFRLSGLQVDVTASVGIAFSGRGDQLPEHLLQDADTAMYQAKRKGGARHQIIDLREQHLAAQRATLERDLRGAPARGELRTDYQPIVDTGDGRDHRRRGPAALGPSIPGARGPDAGRSARRAVRPHQRDRTVGPRARLPRPAPLAQPGPTTSPCRSTCPPTSSCRPIS